MTLKRHQQQQQQPKAQTPFLTRPTPADRSPSSILLSPHKTTISTDDSEKQEPTLEPYLFNRHCSIIDASKFLALDPTSCDPAGDLASPTPATPQAGTDSCLPKRGCSLMLGSNSGCAGSQAAS